MDANDHFDQYGQSDQCENTDFENCHDDDNAEACSGVAHTNYVYKIVQGNENEFFNNDTSMGQRKSLSPRRGLNPWPPRYRLGALTN